VFCDRLDLLNHSYQLLLRAGEKGPRVLAIMVALAEHDSIRYGKTRSLEEICARLVLDGHVPCFSWEVEEVSTPSGLTWAVASAIADARARFGLEPAEYEIFKLNDAAEANLAPRVREQLKLHPSRSPEAGLGRYHNQVLAAAIYQDLRNLADAVGEDTREPKVVLVLDDVHRFGIGACQFLIEHLVVPGCLSGPRNHVPVVMAFSAAGGKAEYGPEVKDLRSLLEGKRVVMHPLSKLEALPDPDKDRYPWDQFLMGQRPPLVADANGQPRVQKAFKMLLDRTGGVPSMLLNGEFLAAVEAFKVSEVFVSADDSELLRTWRDL
jgi:hypothetical protein